MTTTTKQTRRNKRPIQPMQILGLAIVTGTALMTAFLVSASTQQTTVSTAANATVAETEAHSTQSATRDNNGIVFTSGRQKVSLIELYTSEGCSSCPPADRWLSAVGDGAALWENVVPVAFHVSYWDRLGWPDRFAQPKFDTRQRTLAARVDSGVYTPGLFKDGLEFRSWRRTPPQAISASDTQRQSTTAAAQSDAGELSISHVTGNQWQVTYDQAIASDAGYSANPPAQVFAAVLGNNLSNSIGRGENAGKQLDHDFVVLQLEQAKLTPGATLQATFTLDTNSTAKPAIAAWITGTNGAPLQAVGGAL